MTMQLFTFTANPHVEHSVYVPTIEIIAESEQQAREIADRKYPCITQAVPGMESNIVGVNILGLVEWEHPFLHRHLTECQASPVKVGIVSYLSSIPDYGDED